MLNMILRGQKNLDLNRSNFVLLLIFINQLGCAQDDPWLIPSDKVIFLILGIHHSFVQQHTLFNERQKDLTVNRGIQKHISSLKDRPVKKAISIQYNLNEVIKWNKWATWKESIILPLLYYEKQMVGGSKMSPNQMALLNICIRDKSIMVKHVKGDSEMVITYRTY